MDRFAHLNQLLADLEVQLAGFEKALALAPMEDKARLRLLIQEKQREIQPYAEEKAQLEAANRGIAPNPGLLSSAEISFPIVGEWSSYGGLQVNLDPTHQKIILSGAFTSAAGYVKEQPAGFDFGGRILDLSFQHSAQSSFDQNKMLKLQANDRYLSPLERSRINHNDGAYINAGDGTVSFQLPEQLTKLEFVFWNAYLNNLEISGILRESSTTMPSSSLAKPAMISPEPLNVFISYAHADEAVKDELVIGVKNLEREGKIRAWQDRDIEAGRVWEPEIKAALEAADIVLLLVTRRFLASDYCFDIEMTRSLERHDAGTVRVIPIVLSPCEWEKSPCQKLQALPSRGKPVSKWDDRDEAWLDVEKGLRRAVESLQAKKAQG